MLERYHQYSTENQGAGDNYMVKVIVHVQSQHRSVDLHVENTIYIFSSTIILHAI